MQVSNVNFNPISPISENWVLPTNQSMQVLKINKRKTVEQTVQQMTEALYFHLEDWKIYINKANRFLMREVYTARGHNFNF